MVRCVYIVNMIISTKGKNIKALSDALDAAPAWLGNVLARLKVDVDDTGFYDPQAVRQALDSASRMVMAAGDSSALSPEITNTLLTVTEMGADQEGCVAWLKKQFSEHGLKVIGRGGTRNLVTFTLERADGEQMKVSVHAALRLKEKTGQVGFSVSGLEYDDLRWFAFVAKPWGRAYLRNRDDIKKTIRSDKRDLKTAFLTFSPGVNDDLFEKRIDELVGDDASWDLRRRHVEAERKEHLEKPKKRGDH